MKKTMPASLLVPWYKVGMVWVMIGLPFAVVIASTVTFVIAHDNAPLIVTDSTETD